ncbi:putative Secreted Protein [Cryptosporidium tyzzeri]|nr:putative Secreted Protein [Cryptosporidium tyzzeri]
MNSKRLFSKRMPNQIDGSIALCFLALIIFLVVKVGGTNNENLSPNIHSGDRMLWGIIKSELVTNSWMNLSKIPTEITESDMSISIGVINICSSNKIKIKKQLSFKCINKLRKLLDYTNKKDKRYSIRVRKGVSFNEALARLCLDATNKYLNNSSKICRDKETNRTSTKGKKLTREKKTSEKKISIDGLTRITEKSESSEVLKKENLLKLIQSVLFDYESSLTPSRQLISQIRKPKQSQVSRLLVNRDLKGLAILLSNERQEDALSFINVLINGDKSEETDNLTFEDIENKINSKNNLSKITNKYKPFGFMPRPEDEWDAVVSWIQENTNKIQRAGGWMIKKTYGKKALMFPENFVASKGVETVFIDNCFKSLRNMAYTVFTAPNGDKYYKYNKENDYGLMIEGENQNERILNIKNACKEIFERYYEYLGIKTKREEYRFKIHGKLNFLLPLKHDRLFLNKLLKSFYKSINDREKEWYAVVNEARISPLVSSKDLSEEIVPYTFIDERIKRESNLEKKESLLSDVCFKTINTLRKERSQGSSDIPLYNIEIGSENEVSIAKFCKGLFERFILRHIEWLRIIIKSIESDNIKLIDINDPYLEIPEVFLFPEDARLKENCITSLIVVFEKNLQAIENGYPVKVYPQMDYLGDPSDMIENITLFCESLSGKVSPKAHRSKIPVKDEQETIKIMSSEPELIKLIRKNIDSNLLLSFETKMETRIDKITQNASNSNTFRLESWKSHFEEISSLDSHVESMINIFKAQFSEFIDYEGLCEKKIRRYIAHINSKEDEVSDISWLEGYLMDTDRLKGDWATELQSIENLHKSMLAAEGELERYVNTIKSVVYGDEKQKELPQVRKMLNGWPKELSNKERVYIKHKIDSLLSKQRHEYNIESLRYEQLERRKAFRDNLKRSLLNQDQNKPLFFDMENCFKEDDEDLVPIYPEKETKEEEKIRNDRIASIETVLNEFKNRFALINSSLNAQLGGLESFLTKARKDFQTAWTESFNTALALQLQLRTRALVEEYVRASERYLLIKRVKADYEYRKSIVSEFQADPSFEVMLNRASEMIERADEEEAELEKELSSLREQKDKLHLLVEEDMQTIYSQRLKTIRDSKELIRAKIEHEKKLLMQEEKVFEDQLKRDLEYYNIKEISEAAIYRAEKLKMLFDATNWLLNFNEKLTISSETQFREDLEKLDYVIPLKKLTNSRSENDERFSFDALKANLRRHKYTHNEGFDPNDIEDQQELKKETGPFYSDDQTQGQIPVAAQTLLRMFKEKLVIRLNDIDEINQQILQLNLNVVGSFQYYDYNRERAYKYFRELKYSKGASNLFAIILSHFEWEHIQLRWRVLDLAKHVLNEKENKLNEISELRSSLDNKMREFEAIPLSRKLVPIGTSVDMMTNEKSGSRKNEEDSLELLPSSIPSYLLSDEDFSQVRSYDLGAKKIILNRILFMLSANESRYVELLKNTITEINNKKKTAELKIQTIRSDLDELRRTVGYKMLSKEDRDLEEEKFKKKITKITESKNLVPLLAKREILIRKSEKIDSFMDKVQRLFQDPSFTAEQARALENAINEFFGTKSAQFDEITPRIKLAEEINKLQFAEEEIAELEKSMNNMKKQENYAKLHGLKIKSVEIKENISILNEKINALNEFIQEFQDKHFSKVFEVN